MSLFEFPYVVELTLENAGIPRPDGGVELSIDGRDLLARVGAHGHVDFASIRMLSLGTTLRDVPVQFVPDADFHPLSRPCGKLWFRLWKYTWEDTSFPRRFRVYFDRLRDGGKKPWSRTNSDQPGDQFSLSAQPDALELRRADGAVALGFQFPSNRKPALHPLTTPSGATVTETMPRDHVWHRGVWFAWTRLACDGLIMPGYAAWMEPYTAVIHDMGLTGLVSGPVVHGFTSNSLWCTPDGDPLMRVTWSTEFQAVDTAWNWIDLTLTLEAERDGVLLDSDYGHLTARAAMDLRDAYMLDSAANGQPLVTTSREDMQLTWAGYTGIKPAGGAVSLVMLDHPSNPGGPPWRDYFYEIRDFPIEQGALFIAMSVNPIRGRPMRLGAKAPMTWRYRLVTSDRLLTPEFAEYHYRHWATPWQAIWKESS